MIIDLTQNQEREISFDELIQPEEIDLGEEEIRLVEPVEIKGILKKGIVQLDVEGTIDAQVETKCSRCFGNVEVDLQFPFKSTFVTAENYTQAEETEVQLNDLDLSIYEGDKIDLSEIAREQILLNIPSQPLCREECKGLCEKCGANLNETDCNCDKTEIDPRWQGLRDILNKN